MSILYVRVFGSELGGREVTFVHSKEELRSIIENYYPCSRLLLGDLSLFRVDMISMLLKFLEANSLYVDCWSSMDNLGSVLRSRFIECVKRPIDYRISDVVGYYGSVRDYASSIEHLSSYSSDIRLYAPILRRECLDLVL